MKLALLVTAKESLTASVTPAVLAVNVRVKPVPSSVNVRSLKVAVPDTTGRVVVPPTVAPSTEPEPGVTLTVMVVTSEESPWALPTSRTWTFTAGAIAGPRATRVGWTVMVRWSGTAAVLPPPPSVGDVLGVQDPTRNAPARMAGRAIRIGNSLVWNGVSAPRRLGGRRAFVNYSDAEDPPKTALSTPHPTASTSPRSFGHKPRPVAARMPGPRDGTPAPPPQSLPSKRCRNSSKRTPPAPSACAGRGAPTR